MRPRHAAPFVAAFFFVLSARSADAPTTPAPIPPDPNKAEGRFKNIQSLKGYPADDLVPAMQFISAALGVDCDYCHVDHAPEKDDKKPKVTARKMIAMNLAINHDNFDGRQEVTCMSCHRGATRPVAIPAIASGEQTGEAAAPAAVELPAVGSVLDKYAQAIGGAAAVAKIETRVQKGKLLGLAPEPVPVDVTTKAPDKRITTVHGQRGDSITAFDGKNGWLGNSGRPPRDMSPVESAATRLDASLLFPSDWKSLFQDLKVVSTEKIDGKDAVKVVAKREGGPSAELWFDAQTGLVVRLKRYAATPLGLNPTEIDYGDFRAADGVTIPFRWSVGRPSGRFTIQLDESKQNVPVDDKTFEKTAPPPPPPTPPPS